VCASTCEYVVSYFNVPFYCKRELTSIQYDGSKH